MWVLLVEDDDLLGDLLTRELRRDGYMVGRATTRAAAAEQLAVLRYQILVVDRNLPDGDGLDVLRAYRAEAGAGGAILITVRDSLDDIVDGLEAGADDYLSKPFEIRELRARIKALLRRAGTWADRTQRVGDLTIDFDRRAVGLAGQVVPLAPKEWLILSVLARNVGSVVSRADLITHLWDTHHRVDAHALDVHLFNLRTRLARLGSTVAIVTRRGAGHQLLANGGV